MAIELIFERDPDILIAEMTCFLEKMERVASKKTVEDYLALYADMYVRISELSGNDFLYKIRLLIKNQLAPYKPLRCFLFSKSDAIESSMKEERALLKAVKSRDGRKIKHKARGRWIKFLPSEEEWEEHIKTNG